MAIWSRGGLFPNCPGLTYLDDKACRVAAFSDFGKLFPSRKVPAPPQPSHLKRAASELQVGYQIAGKQLTIGDYLNRYPVTGFLVAKDDTILFERYQYGRTDKHTLTSFSMAKTITGLLVGLALERKAIRSIDDTADVYVPELKGTEYGRTPLRALLQMASGVKFSEAYGDRSSDIYTLARLTLEQDPVGIVGALPRFNTRLHPPGEWFNYSSAESLVLGLVVARSMRRSISELTSELLWRPLGAEADASWNVDARGQEVTYAYYNAVVRDWARLGLMLAHRGEWAGQRIVPERWVTEATTVQPGWPSPVYGYHVWISHLNRNAFYLMGLRGQFVTVNPTLRLVIVQTSLDTNEFQTEEFTALTVAIRELLR
ncbi:MAG: serine hydrolase [Reyranellaceae bacterium]